MMKILFCSYAYPNAGQPQLAVFNRSMLAGLSQEHEVRVLAPVPFLQRMLKQPVTAGFQVLPNVVAEYPTFYYPPKLMRERYDEFLWWSIGDRFMETIESFQPDVLLSYWAHPDGAVAVRAGELAGLPTVLMVGGSDVLVLGRSGRRRERILQTLQQANQVVAVSQDIARTMREDGIDAERIHVVPRGIDPQIFSAGSRSAAREALGLPTDRAVLVGAGRFVSVKDWPGWIAACGHLKERGIPFSAYLIGSGPLRKTLERQIQAAGMCSQVTIVGPQSQSQLADWYRAADLTLLSSVSEGIPNVLLETIACGGSFVATNVGGIPEISDDVYDRLVPANSPMALALAVIDRLQHPPPSGYERCFTPRTLTDASRELSRILNLAVRNAAGRSPSPAVMSTPDVDSDAEQLVCTDRATQG